MDKISIIGVDLAKRVFQIHGVALLANTAERTRKDIETRSGKEGADEYEKRTGEPFETLEALGGATRHFLKTHHGARELVIANLKNKDAQPGGLYGGQVVSPSASPQVGGTGKAQVGG